MSKDYSKFTFNRVAYISFIVVMGLILFLYLTYSSIRYWRSTFFIYPDIQEKYEIAGKIDTPKEALEVCRSKLGVIDNCEYQNIMRENIWEGKIRELNSYSKEESRLFQIRVTNGFQNDWTVVSSIETESSKKCFFCFNIAWGMKSTDRRCTVDSNGLRVKFPNSELSKLP